MKTNALIALLVTGLCAVASACATVAPPAVKGASRSIVYPADRGNGVTDVALLADGVGIATRRYGVALTAAGRMGSTINFPRSADFYPVTIEPNAGAPRFLAHDGERTTLFMFDSTGREVGRFPSSYAADFALISGRQGELVAIEEPREKRIALFDISGRRRTTTALPFFIAAMRSEGAALLVAAYPNDRRGTTMYRVDAEGRLEELHTLHAIGDFSLVGENSYAVIRGDSIELRSRSTGSVDGTIALDRADRFRDLHAALLPDGSVVIALSGRGGFDRHRIVWAEPDGTVIHDEEGSQHAYGVVPLDMCTVLIATDEALVRLTRDSCPPPD